MPRLTTHIAVCAVAFALLLGARTTSAAPPVGYYDSVDTTDPATLRATLHDVIDDHTRYPYTSYITDTWDILELADENPNDPNHILDVYKNASHEKFGGGTGPYNREHSWPKSYGFPDDGDENYAYTDCHHLFLCEPSYNSNRSHKPYRYCDDTCTEKPTAFNNGQGGGSGTYPGNSNWTTGSSTTGTWETWIGRRGDVARALLYMDVRYEGGTHGDTGAPEPDLILTDSQSLMDSSQTGNNEPIAYMGLLSVLLQWHQEDPVDPIERRRNDVVHSFQGNRNAFIDHPEWVRCVFEGVCGGGAIPAAPTGLVATGGDSLVDLTWDANTEPDLAGYNVQQAVTSGGPFERINEALVIESAFTDRAVTNGITYYYTVTAVSMSNDESGPSNEASATPTEGGGPAAVPWINEIHYDNTGADTEEGVEVAGPAGVDLLGWRLVGYNGDLETPYYTVFLSGVIPNQQGGYGTRWFSFNELQNGAPDGVALVDAEETVIEFLSYEGSFTATDGPAAGMTSTDIGVYEPYDTPIGDSLQLQGTGAEGSDFTWSDPAPHTRGAVNNDQSFNAARAIPAVSEWGIAVLLLLMLSCGTLVFVWRRSSKRS